MPTLVDPSTSPPFPSFSISVSSAARLNTCTRQHYWAVYGSHRGWEEERKAGDPAHDAYVLKCGKTLGALVGESVHEIARQAFDGAKLGLQRDLRELRAVAHLRMADMIGDAHAGKWATNPRHEPMVLELFYDDATTWAGKVQRAREDLDAAIDALFVNEHFLAVTEGRAAPLYAEERREWAIALTPELGVKVWVQPDLVYAPQNHASRRVVVDWKTGRADEVRTQLGVYVGWLAEQEQLAVDDIVGVAVLLPQYTEKVERGAAKLVVDALEHLRAAALVALSFVEGGDPTRNQPKPIEAFAMLPEGSKPCKWCPYRRLCGRG